MFLFAVTHLFTFPGQGIQALVKPKEKFLRDTDQAEQSSVQRQIPPGDRGPHSSSAPASLSPDFLTKHRYTQTNEHTRPHLFLCFFG